MSILEKCTNAIDKKDKPQNLTFDSFNLPNQKHMIKLML